MLLQSFCPSSTFPPVPSQPEVAPVLMSAASVVGSGLVRFQLMVVAVADEMDHALGPNTIVSATGKYGVIGPRLGSVPSASPSINLDLSRTPVLVASASTGSADRE